MLKFTFKGMYNIMKNSEEYGKAKDLFLQGLSEFSGRLAYPLTYFQ